MIRGHPFLASVIHGRDTYVHLVISFYLGFRFSTHFGLMIRAAFSTAARTTVSLPDFTSL
jgi:hypothetical protein